MGTIRIQEGSGDIHDLLSSPEKHKPRALCHHGYRRSLQIFLCRILQKCLFILFVHNDRHTLLGFRDCNLRSVKAGVFFRNQVKVYPKARSQLSDGYRHAACSKIVTLLDKAGHLRTAEQSLDLALCGRISLLYLSAAGLDRRLCMNLGGTGRSAAAVTACSSAQQNNQIPGIGGLADHILPGSRAENSADLHALCHIVRMIDFFYVAGSQSNLVSVGAVPLGRSAHQLFLGQLALQGLFYRHRRIRRSRHTHGLIYIGSSRQRIADRSAQAGCRASEGLNLRRMIVGLVFKIHQPLLGLSVYLHGHHNRAGIDFLRFLLILQLSLCLQLPHSHQSQIHQADKFILAALQKLRPVCQVLLVGLLNRLPVIAVREAHIRKLCRKGRMPAMVGPIGIQHPDLRHGRIPFLFVPEIILDMQKITERHSQIQRVIQRFQLRLAHAAEALKDLDVCRILKYRHQSIRLHLV